jgi:hypothetical protein
MLLTIASALPITAAALEITAAPATTRTTTAATQETSPTTAGALLLTAAAQATAATRTSIRDEVLSTDDVDDVIKNTTKQHYADKGFLIREQKRKERQQVLQAQKTNGITNAVARYALASVYMDQIEYLQSFH